MSKKYRNLVADFETTSDPDDCRVWSWAMADIDPEPTVTFGTTLQEFIDDIQNFSAKIWFHNLKFDASFIIDHLLRIGYTWTNDRVSEGQFGGLVSFMGEHYQIRIQWHTGHTTLLQDSLKKIPMSVKHVAETFKLPVLKGDIDHAKHRPIGYRPTHDEWDYVRNDVVIMAMAMHQRLDDGAKLTVGADALADYKKVFGTKKFEKFFPILDHDMDETIRLAYRGGFTYASPTTQGRVIGQGSVYDVNSLYPYVMMDKPLPYGLPTWFDAYPPDDGLYIVSITFTARLKPDKIPTIQIKNTMRFVATEYLSEVPDPTTIVVTNVDLALMRDHYDLNILAFNGGYRFEQATGFFREYITKWSKIKETTTGGERAIAKLFLNSLYGKFATNPDVTGKQPVLDGESDTVQFVDGPEETRDPVYTAMGVFITSWARDVTIRAAQQNFHRFMYADTDSLHLSAHDAPAGITVDDHQLGAWDHEYDFERAIFLRAKQYVEELADGSTKVAIAGAPENVQSNIRISDMIPGNTFHGALKAHRVPGGIVLKETTFTLN